MPESIEGIKETKIIRVLNLMTTLRSSARPASCSSGLGHLLLSVKFCWNTAISICLCSVCGCSELSRQKWDLEQRAQGEISTHGPSDLTETQAIKFSSGGLS